MKDKYYLGDSVYVEFKYGEVILTTEDGYSSTNIIIMDYGMIELLQEYTRKYLVRK